MGYDNTFTITLSTLICIIHIYTLGNEVKSVRRGDVHDDGYEEMILSPLEIRYRGGRIGRRVEITLRCVLSTVACREELVSGARERYD